MGSGAATPLKPPGQRKGSEDFWSFMFCFQNPLEARFASARDDERGGIALGPDHGRSALLNESVQADRAISTGKLNTLRCLHTRPINVVVFHGSQGVLVSRWVSRLDAFSGYPVRT